MQLQSAIFDMDGTLLDSMQIWDHLAAGMLRQLGYDPAPEMEDVLKVLSLREGVIYCKDLYHLPQSVDMLCDMISDRVDRFYRQEVTAKPGVPAFLDRLRQAGVRMYVATATDRPLAEVALQRAGLAGYFSGLLTCAEAGQGKNDGPAVFEMALARLHGRKEDTVIFEDALHAIRTAKAAGFRVAAVYDAFAEEDQPAIRALADYYIRTFEDPISLTS